MSDLRWHLLYFQHVQNGTTFQYFPGYPLVLAFTISALDDVNSLVTVLVHCSPFSFPRPQAPSSRCWLIRHLRENRKNVPLSSGRRNVMPGFIAWPTELSLNVLTQDITSTTVHSSSAYTFLTAVCITPLKGSRVLSLLCSKPHKSLVWPVTSRVSFLYSPPSVSRKNAVGGKKAFPQMSQTPQSFFSHCLFPQVAKICLQYPSDWLSHILQVFGQMSFF